MVIIHIISRFQIWNNNKNYFFWRLSAVNFHNSNKYENIILCTVHTSEMKHTVTVLSHTVVVICTIHISEIKHTVTVLSNTVALICIIHISKMKHTVTVLLHTVAVIRRSIGRSHYCCRYNCWLTMSLASMSAPRSSSAIAVSVRPYLHAYWKEVQPT